MSALVWHEVRKQVFVRCVRDERESVDGRLKTALVRSRQGAIQRKQCRQIQNTKQGKRSGREGLFCKNPKMESSW